MNKIEEYLLNSQSVPKDEKSVARQLEIQQWIHLYGTRLLSDGSPETELNYLSKVVWDDECWEKEESLKGVKLNRRKVGRKLLAQTSSGVDNPLTELQKFKVASWLCLDSEMNVSDELKAELDNNMHGEMVEYWSRQKIHPNATQTFFSLSVSKFLNHAPQYPQSLETLTESNSYLHYGFEVAVRNNNVEALDYFWNKLKDQSGGGLLTYAATIFHTPRHCGHNETVIFALDNLDASRHKSLLERDYKCNQHYSILYHLIRNFEFDRATKLYCLQSESEISYFDYSTLIYCLCRVLLSPPCLLPQSKFHEAGCEMLSTLTNLEAASSTYNFLISIVKSSTDLTQKAVELRRVISRNLEVYRGMRLNSVFTDQQIRTAFNIHTDHKFVDSAVIKTLLETEGATLNRIEVENALDKFRENDGDSSDDEDEVKSYDAIKAAGKLQEFRLESKESELYKQGFSFIVHAVALKLLYSSDVRTAYREKRKNHKMYKRLPSYDEICVAIDNTAYHLSQFDKKDSTTEVLSNDICKEINKNPNKFVNAVMRDTLKAFFTRLGEQHCIMNDLVMGTKYFEFGTLKGNVVVFNEESGSETPFDLVDRRYPHFFVEFFSNLRLHNTFEKIRLARAGNTNSEKDTCWRYSKSVEVKVKNGIIGRLRKEEVRFGELGTATYKQIHSLIRSETRLDLFDVFKNGELVDGLSENASRFHYLLFGTEVLRNPSSLIHHMMIFDLIKANKLDWADNRCWALINKMPMSMENAVMASRVKNSIYCQSMPHKYLYDDKSYEDLKANWCPETKEMYENATSSLLGKEKWLTECWLVMKGLCIENYIDKHTGRVKIESVGDVFNELQKSCKEWFNVDLS